MDAEALSGDRQRRAHKKSRNGCLQCKKRHVKCDEQRPICGLCKKVKKNCSLALHRNDETSSESSPRDSLILPSNASPILRQTNLSLRTKHKSTRPIQAPLNFTSFSGTSLPANLNPPHLQSLPMLDLELLYHQMRHNEAFGLDTDNIQLGFAFPYLLHSILSCSALLLFSQQPTRTELLDRACAHQNSALVLMRPHLLDLNSSNVEAVLQFSAITSVMALAQPLYQHPYRVTKIEDPIDDILNSFHMTRGIKTILEQKWQLEGEPQSGGGPDMDDEDPWEQGLMSRYSPYPVLRDLITKTCISEADRLVCLDATRKVFSFITILEEYPAIHPDARLVQIWPIEVDKHYIDMLKSRAPIALLILGYYSVLMRLRSDTMWPFDAWPGILLTRVDELLGEEWAEYLEWPKTRVLSWETSPSPELCGVET